MPDTFVMLGKRVELTFFKKLFGTLFIHSSITLVKVLCR